MIKHHIYCNGHFHWETADQQLAYQEALSLLSEGHSVRMCSHEVHAFRVMLQRIDQRTVTVEAPTMDHAGELAAQKLGDDIDTDEWEVVDITRTE